MPRYWVIAPYHADRPQLWERVWKYDLDNGIISNRLDPAQRRFLS